MRRFVGLFLMVVLLSAVVTASQLEIFSWWTAGGEAEALEALIKVFNKYYPDVEVINATVAGGAGTNAKAVLKTRILGGNPPDSFQVHAGMELIDTYVIPGYMTPITNLLEQWVSWTNSRKEYLKCVVTKEKFTLFRSTFTEEMSYSITKNSRRNRYE